MSYAAFPSGPFETNAYLLFCPKTLETAIIDPSPGSAPLLEKYISHHKLIPKQIWLTHSHWDHIADTSILKKKHPLKVLIHRNDALNLEEPGSDQLPCWLDIEGVRADHFLIEGEKIELGSLEALVIETPGHTPGGVCFYLAKEHLLFSGDTLFKGTIGNLSFPTARPSLMWQSLAKLAKLPANTLVLPGHGEATTIGSERWLSRAEELFS